MLKIWRAVALTLLLGTSAQAQLTEQLAELVRRGDVDAVAAFLDKCPTFVNEHMDGALSKPLHLAAEQGNIGLARLLLTRGALVDARDRRDGTPLMRAARRDLVAMVKVLVEAGADTEACTDHGETSLHRAADAGATAAVQQLLESGADVDGRDSHGWTPLHKATGGYGGEASCTDVVAALVGAGATVDARTEDGHRPIELASRRGHFGAVGVLANHGADLTGVSLVKAAAYPDVVQQLLGLGADPNEVDELGRTLLHLAAGAGHEALVRDLLGRDADPLAMAGDEGNTPLAAAITGKGTPAILTALLGAGADLQWRSQMRQRTLLHLAVWYDRQALVAALLEHDRDLLAARDNDGRTPLHLAASRGHRDVATMLLDAGAEVDALDAKKFTPLGSAMSELREATEDVALLLLDRGATWSNLLLHHAAHCGAARVAAWTLAHGADVNARDPYRNTALFLAIDGLQLELVELLLEAGARVGTRNCDGMTPAKYARELDGIKYHHGGRLSEAERAAATKISELVLDRTWLPGWLPYCLAMVLAVLFFVGWTAFALVAVEKDITATDPRVAVILVGTWLLVMVPAFMWNAQPPLLGAVFGGLMSFASLLGGWHVTEYRVNTLTGERTYLGEHDETFNFLEFLGGMIALAVWVSFGCGLYVVAAALGNYW